METDFNLNVFNVLILTGHHFLNQENENRDINK